MSNNDALLEKVTQDIKLHDRFSVDTDAHALLLRDSHLTDPQLRSRQLSQDSLALREAGMTDEKLKSLGFPAIDAHIAHAMNETNSRNHQYTRGGLPGLYLNQGEVEVIGEMERPIAAGDVQKQAEIASRFKTPVDQQEFAKLSKVVTADEKKGA